MKVILCLYQLFDRQLARAKQYPFEMESDSEFPSTFSKLNVNAVEFVPSFAATTAKDSDSADEEGVKPENEAPENNGNGELPPNLVGRVAKVNFFCHIECRCKVMT